MLRQVTMDKGHFLDYSQEPSQHEVRAALGKAYTLWERLDSFIETNYRVSGSWSSWGPAESGWGFRYHRKGKALVALYPRKKMFVAQVVLGRAQAERAKDLDLGDEIRRMLMETPQLRDGKWLLIPVQNEADVAYVERLLLAKMSPVRDKT